MGIQRNKSQMKDKGESPEKELNDMKENNLSDKEFRLMLKRVLKN